MNRKVISSLNWIHITWILLVKHLEGFISEVCFVGGFAMCDLTWSLWRLLLRSRCIHCSPVAGSSHTYSGSRRLAHCHLNLIRGGSTDWLLTCVSRTFFLVRVIILGCIASHLLLRAGFLHHPVEDEVILVAHPVEKVLEKLSEVANVGLLLKLKTAAIVEVNAKFVWKVLGEGLDRCWQFLVSDLLIFLFLGASGEALPRQAALIEVHKDEAEGFEVISTTLLNAQVGVDGGIARGSCQILAIAVRDMLASLRVTEPLGQTEINNVYVVLLLANSNEEVVRLDITMEEVPRMDELDSLEHLIGQHKHCFQGEFAFAVVK